MEKKYKVQRLERRKCARCSNTLKMLFGASVIINIAFYIGMKFYYNKYMDEKEMIEYAASKAPYKVG